MGKDPREGQRGGGCCFSCVASCSVKVPQRGGGCPCRNQAAEWFPRPCHCSDRRQLPPVLTQSQSQGRLCQSRKDRSVHVLPKWQDISINEHRHRGQAAWLSIHFLLCATLMCNICAITVSGSSCPRGVNEVMCAEHLLSAEYTATKK